MALRKRNKVIIYSIILLVMVFMACYVFQPLKKGKGSNPAIQYTMVKNWPALPSHIQLGNPTGLAIDTSGNLVVFHRAGRTWPLFGSMPATPIKEPVILIINKDDGTLINSWGNNLFVMPHGISVDAQNNIWVTDVGLHQVFKFTHAGKLLMTIGEAGVSGTDSLHFNKPTAVAIANDGSFYVSDGYGNSRIMKFSASGKYLLQWGKKGNGPGEFNIPHGLSIANNGDVIVADRENDRIQVFNENGKYLKIYSNVSFGEITAVAFDQQHQQLFVADDVSFLKLKHRGSDILQLDTTGQAVARFGRSGNYMGPDCWYHALAIDKAGNIYAGDILGNTIQKFVRKK